MDNVGLEGQRLAFEKLKWDDERKLRELEVTAKERESSWTGRLFSPLTTTLMAGILTIAGTATATLLQGWSTLQLEAKKEQHDLVAKMVSVGDVEQARKNLKYLAEVGLVDPDLAAKIKASKEPPAVLPRPSGLPSSLTPPIVITPEEFKRRVSPEPINMIVNFETGGGRSNFEANLSHPSWLGGQSGLTIGFGYDLGYVTEEMFRRDWRTYLTPTESDRLALMIGIRGPDTRASVSKFADITVRWEDALAVLTGGPLPRMATLLESTLPNAQDLAPDSYGALVSLVYNRDGSFAVSGDRFNEMRNIRDLMERKQFESIPAQLRSMTRLWPNTALATRREQEAKLFEKGFAPRDAQVVVPTPQ